MSAETVEAGGVFSCKKVRNEKPERSVGMQTRHGVNPVEFSRQEWCGYPVLCLRWLGVATCTLLC